jgi:hypothetical protein
VHVPFKIVFYGDSQVFKTVNLPQDLTTQSVTNLICPKKIAFAKENHGALGGIKRHLPTFCPLIQPKEIILETDNRVLICERAVQ